MEDFEFFVTKHLGKIFGGDAFGRRERFFGFVTFKQIQTSKDEGNANSNNKYSWQRKCTHISLANPKVGKARQPVMRADSATPHWPRTTTGKTNCFGRLRAGD